MKVILLKGLPGAGKSTRAKEICKDKTFVRVNKDLLREMLHFGVWSYKNEKIINKTEQLLAQSLLEQGKNVVVDDCNFTHIEKWKEFLKYHPVHVEVEEINTPIEECVTRDWARGAAGGRTVGYSVIRGMAMYTGQLDYKYVICDLDGTLADNAWRARNLTESEKATGKKDWHAFHMGIPNDAIREDVWNQVKSHLGEDTKLILVSARNEQYRGLTVDWLKKMGVDHYALFMREDADKRPDTMVKRDILNMYFKDKSRIVAVFDDRPSVIRMWQEEGLHVIDVGDGIEF